MLAELGYRVTALDLSSAMLARAIEKAADRGLELQTWVAPASEPPPGPFDAVVERHLLWTVPDPVEALRAWRLVAPRLVSYEGLFARSGPVARVRRSGASLLRRLQRIEHDHHAEYEPDLRAALPLAGRMGPQALIDSLAEAGWRRYRIERLRDIEWARRLAAPTRLLGLLETVPHFAVMAEA